MQSQPEADQNSIVKVLADVLTALCEANDKQPAPECTSKFHAAELPSISIYDYLLRIKKYAQCSTQCFIIALIFIDRLIEHPSNFTIRTLNIHRILITTIMLAAKFFDDQYYNNKYYARIGGVSPDEINELEIDYLSRSNFQLFIEPAVYTKYYRQLTEHLCQHIYQHQHQGVGQFQNGFQQTPYEQNHYDQQQQQAHYDPQQQPQQQQPQQQQQIHYDQQPQQPQQQQQPHYQQQMNAQSQHPMYFPQSGQPPTQWNQPIPQ